MSCRVNVLYHDSWCCQRRCLSVCLWHTGLLTPQSTGPFRCDRASSVIVDGYHTSCRRRRVRLSLCLCRAGLLINALTAQVLREKFGGTFPFAREYSEGGCVVVCCFRCDLMTTRRCEDLCTFSAPLWCHESDESLSRVVLLQSALYSLSRGRKEDA